MVKVPKFLNHSGNTADLQLTGKQRGSFGFRQHCDLLEGQKVMDVDVVLCVRRTLNTFDLLRN